MIGLQPRNFCSIWFLKGKLISCDDDVRVKFLVWQGNKDFYGKRKNSSSGFSGSELVLSRLLATMAGYAGCLPESLAACGLDIIRILPKVLLQALGSMPAC